jgi:flavin reductase (DIM6/NTAB) family NADH-FMN oxidoreductase RutF
MRYFNRQELDELDRIYRINLINSCSGFKSANLIGTKSQSGSPNLAVFSSVIHMGSNPPLLGFVLRPTKVARHTYSNIKETGFYTINHVVMERAEQAHHTSAKYEADVSEFDVTGLKETYRNGFHPPFVDSSPVQIGMKFVEEHFIQSNETLLVIGEMQHLHVQEHLLEQDGFVNLSKGQVASICGLDGYSLPSEPKRFGYQRPKDIFNPQATQDKEWSQF